MNSISHWTFKYKNETHCRPAKWDCKPVIGKRRETNMLRKRCLCVRRCGYISNQWTPTTIYLRATWVSTPLLDQEKRNVCLVFCRSDTTKGKQENSSSTYRWRGRIRLREEEGRSCMLVYGVMIQCKIEWRYHASLRAMWVNTPIQRREEVLNVSLCKRK